MAIVVNHPVLGRVSFPDNYTPQQIDAELLQLGSSLLPEKSSGDVFFNQLGEGFEATIEGLGQLTGLGGEPTQEDYIDEFQNRVELEQNPVAGYGGYVVGAILDPITIPAAFFKPIVIGGKLATGAARGATGGVLYGATAPVYEEFGDSRLLNTTVGGVFGGALGGALSKITAADITKPVAPEKMDDAVDSVLEDVAESVTPQVRVAETAEPQPISVGPERALAKLEEELTPLAQPALKSGDRKATEELVTKLETRVANMERTKPKRGSQVAKNLEATKQEVNKLKARLSQNTDEAQAARLDLENLRKGEIDKLSPASRARVDELSTIQVKPKTPIQQAVRTQADVAQEAAEQPIFFVRPTVTRPVAATPVTKTLEQISEDTKQVIQRAVTGEPEPVPTMPQRQFTMDDIMQRRVVGSGAARVSPLQTADELNLKWAEKARLQSESLGPRMVTRKYLPPTAAPGEKMSVKVEPGAFPEFEFPAGPVRNYAAKFYQALNPLRYGSNVARGRGDTRGSGTMKARINAAERWISNLEEEGKYVEDFLLSAKRGDIGATQIMGSARVQADIQEIVKRHSQEYEDLIEEFGTIDAIPKAIYDEHVARSVPALMINAKLSGAMTEASDMMNASKWVKQALGLNAKGKIAKTRMTELFGTRCI